MSNDVLIKVEGVSKKFCRSLKKSLWYGLRDMAAEATGGSRNHDRLRLDEFWAVNGVSFELRRGECLGLIGHNGAGKTTLLKMLNGLIKPDVGSITMRGSVGALIALGAGFNPILTGRENIYVNGSVLGLSKREIDRKIEEIIDFAGIRDFIDAPVQSYSSGMQVRLGFAVATALGPNILLLDEVLAVGDPAFQARCFNRIGEFRRTGTGFILVSHNMHQITRFCDRVMLLSKGQASYIGATEKAVEMFNHETMRMKTAAADTLKADQPTGSGAATIEKVFFQNDRGERVEEVASREPVTLCVVFEVRRPVIRNPVLDITIRDSGDLCFQGTNRSFGCELGELPSSGTIRIRFDGIPANNQKLLINMALWDASFTELYDWKRDTRLIVKGNPQCSGRTFLECTWEVAEQACTTKRT